MPPVQQSAPAAAPAKTMFGYAAPVIPQAQQPAARPPGGPQQPGGYPPGGQPPGQSNPYGQPPQQQANPYGQPPQQQASPYGQPPAAQSNPYGQPPQQQANPYGQPQAPHPQAQSQAHAPQAQPQQANPYGQPQQPQQNPYGQPQPQANPYGQPQQPQQNPYGQPQPQANPYGQPQPQQNPYGQPQAQAPAANPYGQPQPQTPAANPYGQQPNPYGAQQGYAPGQAPQQDLPGPLDNIARGIPQSAPGTIFGFPVSRLQDPGLQRKVLLFAGIALVASIVVPVSLNPLRFPFQGGGMPLFIWPLIAGGLYLLVAAAPAHIREKVPPIVLQWIPFGVSYYGIFAAFGGMPGFGGANSLAYALLVFGLLARIANPNDQTARIVIAIGAAWMILGLLNMLSYAFSFGSAGGAIFGIANLLGFVVQLIGCLCICFIIPPAKLPPALRAIDSLAPVFAAVLILWFPTFIVLFMLGGIIHGLGLITALLMGARALLYWFAFFGVLMMAAPAAYEAVMGMIDKNRKAQNDAAKAAAQQQQNPYGQQQNPYGQQPQQQNPYGQQQPQQQNPYGQQPQQGGGYPPQGGYGQGGGGGYGQGGQGGQGGGGGGWPQQ